MQKKILAVFDFDNTLFNWVHVWYSCFTAMMQEVERKTGLSVADLANEIRPVHQQHGTSEYAFLLEALPSLQPFLNGQSAADVFGDAIRAFRKTRKKELRLYPTVADTLLRIKGAGCRIAIYTESQSFYSFFRLKRLGLDGVIDRIYTPPDHDLPDDFLESGGRHYSRDFYHLRYAEHRHTPAGELKPNPDLLSQIIADFGVAKDEAVYVGDSRQKDVAMAKDAGVDYAWASYGEAQETDAYEVLKLVTHWTDEDVARENEIRSRKVDADINLNESLSQLLLKLEAGAAVPPHFHLGAGEFIVLSGELRYASGTAGPGDYGYEAIGAHHEKTHAAEETVIFYVGHGPLAMLDAEGRICGATGSDGVNAFAMAHG